MADNPVKNGFDFEQFQSHRIALNLREARASLPGDIFVVKIYDANGNTYYLGTAGQSDELNLVLSLPRHLQSLWLEIFTEQASAGSLTEEIQL